MARDSYGYSYGYGKREGQFEWLLVLINDLEEPSDWFGFEDSYTEVRTLPTLCSILALWS